ncbi:MAG: cytochrome oxidase maturation protein, cbb3-type [Gallionellales bacterium GWA2_55_18]|nr:MAG: cytochrome oxidase maturation protein, cbb3-type [Gallionellales bacterium GWA2_55_18]
MEVIYGLIPGMMFFGLIFLVVLIWAVKKGQYEDMEGNASRILMDDDAEMMGHTKDIKADKKNRGNPEEKTAAAEKSGKPPAGSL